MLHKLLVSSLPLVPRSLMRRIAGRYIAGERIEDAIAKLRELGERGYSGILDILGENIRSPAEARAAAAAYVGAAEALARQGIDAYVSVKPTHMGLLLDRALALELYRGIAERCKALGLFVRVEMEDHPTTDATLELFELLRKDFDNVGVVLQSRLLRTPRDIDALAPGPLDVRMVKGIYLEPPEIAHTSATAIRDAFYDCTDRLLQRGARVRLATHDQALAARLILLMHKRKRTDADFEFQVLLGVQEQLWELWRKAGHRVRVYVPYGPEWRAYSQRRLRHNPELFRAVLRNVLGGGG